MAWAPQVPAIIGAAQVIEVLDATTMLPQAEPPTVTVAPDLKPVPVNVIVLPELLTIAAGATLLSTGGPFGGGVMGCHMALTCLPESRVTLQVDWVPVQAPLQPRKVAPVPCTGVAVSCTVVPTAKVIAQAVPQLIPWGCEVMLPRLLSEVIVRAACGVVFMVEAGAQEANPSTPIARPTQFAFTLKLRKIFPPPNDLPSP
jgi:hypothetical protein